MALLPDGRRGINFFGHLAIWRWRMQLLSGGIGIRVAWLGYGVTTGCSRLLGGRGCLKEIAEQESPIFIEDYNLVIGRNPIQLRFYQESNFQFGICKSYYLQL